MITKEILLSHPVSVLKKEISKTNIKGYSKMRKLELIELMMKPEHTKRFGHIKMGASYIPGDLKPLSKAKKEPVKKDKKIGIKRTPKPAPKPAPKPEPKKKVGIKRTPKPAPKPAPAKFSLPFPPKRTSGKPTPKFNDKNSFTPLQVSMMSTQSLKENLTLFIEFSKYYTKDEILFYKELKDRGAKISKAVEEKYKLTISKNDKGEAKTSKPTPAPAKMSIEELIKNVDKSREWVFDYTEKKIKERFKGKNKEELDKEISKIREEMKKNQIKSNSSLTKLNQGLAKLNPNESKNLKLIKGIKKDKNMYTSIIKKLMNDISFEIAKAKNDKGEAKTPKPTPAPAKKEKELSEFTKEEVEEKYKDLGEFQKVNNKILDRASFILTKDKNKINKMIEVYKKINVQGKKGVSSNFNQVRSGIRDKLERDQQNCETLINGLRSKINFIKKKGSKKDLPFGEKKTIKAFLNEGHELIKKNSSCLNKKQLEEIKNLGIVTKNYYNNLTDTIKEEKEVKDEFLKLYPSKK